VVDFFSTNKAIVKSNMFMAKKKMAKKIDNIILKIATILFWSLLLGYVKYPL